MLDTLRGFIGRRVKELLVVGGDPVRREQIVQSIGGDEFRVETAPNGRDGAGRSSTASASTAWSLDSSLPDMTADGFLQQLRRDGPSAALPVILYSDQPPTGGDRPGTALAPSIVFRQVSSPERLLDQTAFFLHSPVDKLPEAKRRTSSNSIRPTRCSPARKS